VVVGSSGLPVNTQTLQSFLHFVINDVSVDHGRRDLGVSQRLLGQAQIFSLPIQVRGECVPERMGVNVLGDPRLRCQSFYHES
jgi:hypothetical protein